MSAKVRCSPHIQAGVPTIAGTRVPTRAIWSFWVAQYSIGQIAQEYPALSLRQIWAAILFEHRRRGPGLGVRQRGRAPKPSASA